ncbi:copper transporter [Georgenia faecalis]|uniref:Copper transporter n=1 Tax=Georgenia faecalis TaxID=2483799 RepID=A0ABV9DDP8_9MICO|nr:copper transporter [Georgenia faecalis]
MIDFRYHLVSLISVFLALALGILLGAGPLNATIGDQLTGQVADLREDRDRLRTELELSNAETEDLTTYLDGVAPDVLASRLEGRSVALVTLPGANADDVAAVRARLEQSGSAVSGELAVTDAWTDPETASFRSSFAGQLVGYLAPAPEDDAGTDVVLGTALGQALTSADPASAGFTEEAETLLDLLSTGDQPLVAVVEEPAGPANATVVVGPRPEPAPEQETETDSEERAVRTAGYVDLTEGVARTGEGSVVLGAATTELDLVAAIIADPDAAGVVTTVDSVGEITGHVSVPLALAADISGDQGHYGFEEGAQEPVPASVYLPPPAPAEPSPAPTEAAEPTEGSEPTDGAEPTEGEG